MRKFIGRNLPNMWRYQGAPRPPQPWEEGQPRSIRGLKRQRNRVIQAINKQFWEFLKGHGYELDGLRRIDEEIMRKQGLTCQHPVTRDGQAQLCGEPVLHLRGKKTQYCERHRMKIRSRTAAASREKKLTRELGPRKVLGAVYAEQVAKQIQDKEPLMPPILVKKKRRKQPLIV